MFFQIDILIRISNCITCRAIIKMVNKEVRCIEQFDSFWDFYGKRASRQT